MTSTIGIPIKLLNEAQVLYSAYKNLIAWTDSSQGHIVTLEITNGQTYRGRLLEGMISTLRVHALLS